LIGEHSRPLFRRAHWVAAATRRRSSRQLFPIPGSPSLPGLAKRNSRGGGPMPSIRVRLRGAPAILAALAAFASPAAAQDFYAGRSIELLIGAPPGGGYDIYGRVVARHIGRHIPGSPNIVPKNMPGAGSARAAGFIANVAPKDGTVIANIMPGAVMDPM